MPSQDMATRVYFDPLWLKGVEERDWQCLTRNLITACDDPIRLDNELRLDFYRCCDVIDLQQSMVLVPLEQADAILLPICHRNEYFGASSSQAFDRICRLTEEISQRSGLPVVVQGVTRDINDPRQDVRLGLTNFLYLNTAVVATGPEQRIQSHTYAIPDYLEKYCDGQVDPVTPRHKPTVSFWGVCPPFGQSWTKTRVLDFGRLALTYLDPFGVDSERLVRWLGTNMKHAHRARVVRSIQACPSIHFDLQIRALGGMVDGRFWLEADQSEYRRGFYESIHRSLYSICCRGTENYAIRFYETLCLGRIPVVVDTDLRLPLEDCIDYERHCLTIRKSQAGQAAQLILEHFRRHSREELCHLQLANRRLWETHLSPGSFYRQLRPLLQRLQTHPR